MTPFNINSLIGKKITAIRNMTDEEADDIPFGATAIIVLEDGTEIWPQSDDEGNGMGTLVCMNPNEGDIINYIYHFKGD